METWKIRTAIPDDSTAILDVIHRSFEEYRGKLEPPSGAHAEREETILKLLMSDERAFVAEKSVNEEMIGCVFFRPIKQQADTCYLHRLAVVPEARGQGVAGALITAVEEVARASGYDYVSLNVRIALPANRAFYLKRKYYPVAYAAHPGFTAPTYISMRKRLSAPIPREVVLVPWMPEWGAQYQRAAAEIQSILGEHLLSIHHIGSTAVPNIPAKPTIDLLGIVADLNQVDRTEPRLILHGWQPRGENGIPGRRYFRKGGDDKHTHHLHIYQQGNEQIDRQLRFVAYLTTHPEEARRYADLKQRLAAEHPFDAVAYTDAKGPLVEELLAKAFAERAG